MHTFNKILIAASILTAGANGASVVTFSAAEINGGDTDTTSFTDADGLVTITPTIGGSSTIPGTMTAVTFNSVAARLGVDGNGSNNGSFNSAPLGAAGASPANMAAFQGVEGLTLDLGANAGLAGFSYDFSVFPIADGGLLISGFTADPLAMFSGNVAGSTASFDSGTGTLQVITPNFTNDNDTILSLSAAASLGQTLVFTVGGVNSPGGPATQFAATSFSVEAIPEPSSALFLGLAGLAGLVRRKR